MKETLNPWWFSLLLLAAVDKPMCCTQSPFVVLGLFAARVESLFYIWPVCLAFPFFLLSLSSGADHAVCGRDERCHRARWDNPVAVHSGRLKGIAEHTYRKNKKKPSFSTHTHKHTLQARCHHCLLNIIFSFYTQKHAHKSHLLLIVLCVPTRGWCLLMVLWYLHYFLKVHFSFSLKVSVLIPVPQAQHCTLSTSFLSLKNGCNLMGFFFSVDMS